MIIFGGRLIAGVSEGRPLHGLRPTDIEHLSDLRGGENAQIWIGPYDLQFNLQPRGNVSVWGRSELLGVEGELIDFWDRETRAGVFRFPEILMSPITEVTVDSPKSFMMTFTNGLGLRVVDNSDQYESFSVGDFYV